MGNDRFAGNEHPERTYFAPPGRSSAGELQTEIEFVNSYPLVTGLLHSVGGLLAVLNERRQILALNDVFLQQLGVENPDQVLGLRPGEVVHCVHAEEEPGGCGTSRFCSTCGAAVAIVAALGEEEAAERLCALKSNQGGQLVDLVLQVKACPIRIDGRKFLLLFLQDVTQLQQKAALERTFFHDINNTLSMLGWSSEKLVKKDPSPLAKNVQQLVTRLLKEVEIQRCLALRDDSAYLACWEDLNLARVLEELQQTFASHPAAEGQQIDFAPAEPLVFRCDLSLLLRVLSNMLINALEANAGQEEVRLWWAREERQLVFYVWNRQPIPEDVARRVFQRNYSTKGGTGRGLGTYSMKLFGEQVLGGQVGFTSSASDGTRFRFAVPLNLDR